MGVVETVKFHDKTRMIWLLSSPSPLSKTSDWIDKHHAFTVGHQFKNNCLMKMKLKLFRMHFNIHLNQPLPNRFTSYRWTECFRERYSLNRRARPGRQISIRGDVPWPARSFDTAPCDFSYVTIEVKSFSRNPINNSGHKGGENPKIAEILPNLAELRHAELEKTCTTLCRVLRGST